MTAYDPEMMEYFRALLGSGISELPPEDQVKLFGRQLQQDIQMGDLNRNAAALQVPGYTAEEGTSMASRDDGQVRYNFSDPKEAAAVYDLEDASPFKMSGFAGAGPDQGYGEQTLNAWGDAVQSSQLSDPRSDPYNMQLEEPDDEETRKRKAALLSIGGV